MSAILQAKTNKVLDKAEDPRETLDLSYEKQLEQPPEGPPRAWPTSPPPASASSCRPAQLQKQADKLQDQAKAALGQGNEDLAREALTRRAALGEQLAELKAQHAQVAEQEERLVATSQRLQAQIEQFRTKKETLKASYTAAEAQTKVGEAVSGISDVDGRRRPGHAAGPGQDRRHAGPSRGHGRAAGLGGADRSDRSRSTTSRPSSTRCRPAPRWTTSWRPSRPRSARSPGGRAPRPVRRARSAGRRAMVESPAAAADGQGPRRRRADGPECEARAALMSIARNIANDRGLTARMFVTGLLLVVLYGAFIGILFALSGCNLIVIFDGGHRLPLRPVLVQRQDRPVGHARPDRHPRARRPSCTERSTACAPWPTCPSPRWPSPTPTCPTPSPPAAARRHAVVCATTGLLRRLDEPEVEAVLAHELSHVAHRDVAVMTIASSPGRDRRAARPGPCSTPGCSAAGRNDQNGPERGAMEAIMMLVSIDRLRHQLPPDPGPLALPGAGRRPLRGHPHRPALGAGRRSGQDHRRDVADPDPGPPPGRAVQRLLLHPGHRPGRGDRQWLAALGARSPPTRRSSAGWPSWPSSRPSSASPADRPRPSSGRGPPRRPARADQAGPGQPRRPLRPALGGGHPARSRRARPHRPGRRLLEAPGRPVGDQDVQQEIDELLELPDDAVDGPTGGRRGRGRSRHARPTS